ncbi:hypothetical protein OG259_39550 [Streptomyces sp. NBC_00250]|uniref:hypothetical protein n=1 Tax=Streptomyces sp. NBC_00250 TaxID=2903641 RepID=UPI002E2BE8F4|nr:hypothetical protein [Streptomyces sp. NBC_00250]
MEGQGSIGVVVPMPVVFVHGVGNHDEEKARNALRFRLKMFSKFLLPVINTVPREDAVLLPWWGKEGALPRWGHACRPGLTESLGGVDDAHLVQLLAAAEPPQSGRTNDVILDTARDSLADAVDLLYSALDVDSCSDDELEELATLAVPLAAYCERYRQFDPAQRFWDDVGDDSSLVEAFVGAGREPGPSGETLGGGGALSRAGKWFEGTARQLQIALVGTPTRLSAGGLRRLTDDRMQEFLGDVFKYLAMRGTPENPGRIVEIVLDDLRTAVDGAPDGEPLVVVAHSMGGDIVYDIASHFDPKLVIDVLVTVGSQVGLFAECSAFHGVPTDLPAPDRRKVPARANIRTWINVVDRSDILCYSVKPVFEGAEDYMYESGALWAHAAYFKQPNFYSRLAKRVQAAVT